MHSSTDISLFQQLFVNCKSHVRGLELQSCSCLKAGKIKPMVEQQKTWTIKTAPFLKGTYKVFSGAIIKFEAVLHSVFLCSEKWVKLTSPKERKEERKVSTLNTGNAIWKCPSHKVTDQISRGCIYSMVERGEVWTNHLRSFAAMIEMFWFINIQIYIHNPRTRK